MHLNVVRWGGWIYLTHDEDSRRALVNAVMKLRAL